MALLPLAAGEIDRQLGAVDAGELQGASQRLHPLANTEQTIALRRAALRQAATIILQHQL